MIWLAHPWLGVAAAAASLLMLGLAVINDRITCRNIEALQQEAARATRYLESSMQNAEVVQSLGMGDALITRWRQLNARFTELQRPTMRKSTAMAALTRSTRQVAGDDAGARGLPLTAMAFQPAFKPQQANPGPEMSPWAGHGHPGKAQIYRVKLPVKQVFDEYPFYR